MCVCMYVCMYACSTLFSFWSICMYILKHLLFGFFFQGGLPRTYSHKGRYLILNLSEVRLLLYIYIYNYIYIHTYIVSVQCDINSASKRYIHTYIHTYIHMTYTHTHIRASPFEGIHRSIHIIYTHFHMHAYIHT
jgi:hypothetical protein